MFTISRGRAVVAMVGVSTCLIGLALLLGASKGHATAPRNPDETFEVLGQSGANPVSEASASSGAWLAEIADRGGAPVTETGAVETSSGHEVVVAATEDEICARDLSTEASNCGSTAMVTQGRIFVATPAGCDAWTVLGVVPNGVDRLNIERNGAVEGSVPVSSNVYETTLPAEATTLSSADGSIRIKLPLASYSAQNEAC